jgi:hypothetical protein
MKKTILLNFLFCAALSARAQTTLRLHAGVSHNYLNHEFEVDGYREKRYSAPLNGFAFGLGLGYLDKGLFSMGSDLYYFQSGGKDGPSDKDSNIFQAPDRIKTTYLSASTLVYINPLRNNTCLRLGLGPRIDFMTGGQNDPPLEWNKEFAPKGVAKVNAGVNGVLGLYRRSGKLEYGLTATYVNRFRKLVDVDSGIRGQFRYGGAHAGEQSFLFCLTLGRVL